MKFGQIFEISSKSTASLGCITFCSGSFVCGGAWNTSINMSDKTLPEPVIHNMVATATLGMKLDLKSIATRANNAEFNPKRFPAVVLRIRDPKTTALVFSSGKMVLTGAKEEAAAKTAAKKHLKTIQKCGFPAAKLSVCRVD